MSKEIRELTLRKGRFNKSTILKVKKGWSVIFKLAPEFFEHKALSLLINYPEDGKQFERDKYQDIFKVSSPRVGHILTSQVQGKEKVGELEFSQAGPFHFMVCAGQEILSDGVITVDPDLLFPLESVVCQTVLSKLLGRVSAWRGKLEVAHK